MTPNEQFFYDNAGYSYDPKAETEESGHVRCAVELARAERWAAENGYEFEFEQDSEGCIGCDCGSDECACATGEPHECLVLIMRDMEGNVVQSLGSICEPSREYRRVVRAELAVEEMASMVTA